MELSTEMKRAKSRQAARQRWFHTALRWTHPVQQVDLLLQLPDEVVFVLVGFQQPEVLLTFSGQLLKHRSHRSHLTLSLRSSPQISSKMGRTHVIASCKQRRRFPSGTGEGAQVLHVDGRVWVYRLQV